MTYDMTKSQTPEEKELNKKQAELFNLETELAQRELDLMTLQAELNSFEAKYISIVGVLFAELDEIEAQIAEAEANNHPDNDNAREKASKARVQARKSLNNARLAKKLSKDYFKPSKNLKKLFREIAKKIHPDLATDENQRIKRQQLMADANRAYEVGDEERLYNILSDWQDSPDSVEGDGMASDLVRVIRKIAQIEKRLREIELAVNKLIQSKLYQLKKEVESAEKNGRDLLHEMASRVVENIKFSKERLLRVRAFNKNGK